MNKQDKQKATEAIMEKYKLIWAFSNEQFKEQYDKNLTPYVSIGAGGYLPKRHLKNFLTELKGVK